MQKKKFRIARVILQKKEEYSHYLYLRQCYMTKGEK